MPYITRDNQGKIIHAYIQPIPGTELVSYDNSELVEFLKKNGQDIKIIEDSLAELRRTDGDMARAVEDVITVLLKKNILKMSDLPAPVQDKMGKRVKLRMQIQECFDKASNARPSDTDAWPYHSTTY